MPFEFATAACIIFGDNCSAQLPQLVRGLGRHALLFTDSFQPESVSALIAALHNDDLAFTHFPVSG